MFKRFNEQIYTHFPNTDFHRMLLFSKDFSRESLFTLLRRLKIYKELILIAFYGSTCQATFPAYFYALFYKLYVG